MRLCYTELGGYPDPLEPTRLVTARAAADLGLIERMPFVVHDDGTYDAALGRFFRDLPASGAPSPTTWRAYAGDIVLFGRWLLEARGGRTLWEVTVDDLRAYYALRRVRDTEHKVSKETWNRTVAALQRLYQWALEEGLVRALPFRYRVVEAWQQGGGTGGGDAPEGATAPARRNLARERGTSGTLAPRHVSMAEFRFWLRVGIQGRLPDGRPDPDYAGGTAARDALMATLLLATGMRIEEAGTLILAELPRLADAGPGRPDEAVQLRLAPECAKGNKQRIIYLPRRTLHDVEDYRDLERAEAVARATGPGGYAGVGRPVLAADQRAKQGVRLAEATDGTADEAARTRRYTALGPALRRRLVLTERGRPADPAALFLTSRGQPLSHRYWDGVFRAASARCAAAGRPVKITPHDLRHTYAVHLLSKLIWRSAEKARALRDLAPSARAYNALFGDALYELMIRMGHAQVTTTYVYLRCLQEAEDVAALAEGDLVRDIYWPEDGTEATDDFGLAAAIIGAADGPPASPATGTGPA